MIDEEMAAEYAKGLTTEYQDGLVDIDDIDVLQEAIVEAHLAGLKAGRDTAEANLAKAKGIISKLLDDLTAIDGEETKELEAVKVAEQFLKEEENEDNNQDS